MNMHDHVTFVYVFMYFMTVCALMYIGYSCLYKSMQNEFSSSYGSVFKKKKRELLSDDNVVSPGTCDFCHLRYCFLFSLNQ